MVHTRSNFARISLLRGIKMQIQSNPTKDSMASNNARPEQRFSPEEKEAHEAIAKELGYDSPQELGDAIRNNPELKEQVQSMLQEKGIEVQEGGKGSRPNFSKEEMQAHKEIADKLGFKDPKALGDAMKSDPELKQKVGSLLQEKGISPKGGMKPPPPPPPKSGEASDDSSSTSFSDSVSEAAVSAGFGTKESPDVDGYLAALKKGEITGYQSPTGNLVDLAA